MRLCKVRLCTSASTKGKERGTFGKLKSKGMAPLPIQIDVPLHQTQEHICKILACIWVCMLTLYFRSQLENWKTTAQLDLEAVERKILQVARRYLIYLVVGSLLVVLALGLLTHFVVAVTRDTNGECLSVPACIRIT